MQPIRRILVAVKNPEGNASPAVIKAGQLALALGADVELFHAIVTPLYIDSYEVRNGSLGDTERHMKAGRLAGLQAMAKRLQRHSEQHGLVTSESRCVHHQNWMLPRTHDALDGSSYNDISQDASAMRAENEQIGIPCLRRLDDAVEYAPGRDLAVNSRDWSAYHR